MLIYRFPFLELEVLDCSKNLEQSLWDQTLFNLVLFKHQKDLN
jgi:hypothetical protein